MALTLRLCLMAVRLCLMAVLALAASACSIRGIEAASLMRDIAAGHGPSSLKQSRPAPLRVAIRMNASGLRADLYRPGGGVSPLAGLVLVPGVAPAGKDDRRLVALANSLARVRFMVLVPDIANLRRQRVSPDDADRIADAVAHLADRLAARGHANIGIAAISYAVGPAVLAALQPRIRERVSFIVAIGGYYDLREVVTFFTTGHYRADRAAPWRQRQPNRYGKWVFVLSNTERLRNARDRVNLGAMALRRMRDPAADVTDLARDLGAEGRAVHALLTNTVPARVPALLDALPAPIRRDLDALDLAKRDLTKLSARLILVHGRDDAIIPYTQSRALAGAAPRADLYLLDNLFHADLSVPGLFDAIRLWRATLRLLEERDRPVRR